MGGYAALAIARRAPERVAAIVLSASKAAPDTPERRAEREGLIERLRAEGAAGERSATGSRSRS